MRVLYFTRDYTPHDHRFLSALAGTDHQVYSLRLERRDMQREDRPLPPNIEQIIWSGGRAPMDWRTYPALALELRRLFRKIKPDVVHAGSVQTAAFLTALAGYHPLVSMSWGSDILKDAHRNDWMRQLTAFTLHRTRVLVCDCDAVKQEAQRFGFPAQHVVVFPWGVDLGLFSPGQGTLRQQLGWQDQVVLLSLRSWEAIYGVDVVAKAFVQAANQNPDLRLILAGSGSMSVIIHSILSEDGVSDRVYYAGQIANDRLTDFYRSAALYLSASYSDGSSVSLMEALACGLPVLVSDIPGNVEWITPGEQGWLFASGNVQDLTRQMLMAARNRQETIAMRAAARTLAEQRADWKKNFEKLMYAYDLAVQIDKT